MSVEQELPHLLEELAADHLIGGLVAIRSRNNDLEPATAVSDSTPTSLTQSSTWAAASTNPPAPTRNLSTSFASTLIPTPSERRESCSCSAATFRRATQSLSRASPRRPLIEPDTRRRPQTTARSRSARILIRSLHPQVRVRALTDQRTSRRLPAAVSGVRSRWRLASNS